MSKPTKSQSFLPNGSVQHIFRVSLFIVLCVLQSTALDPLYYSPPYFNQRRGRSSLEHGRRQLLSADFGSCPRRVIPASSAYRRQLHRDYSSKLVDIDDFRKDRRSRLWNVDFMSRRPGQYSWTTRLIFANCIMYALQVAFPRITRVGVKMSDKILRGEQLYRLITPVFLHGSPVHLFMNMVSLRNVGHDVERLFGAGRYLGTYLGAGVAGNVLSSIYSAANGLGASGAIFGIIGAELVFLSRNDWLLGRQGEQMQSNILSTVALNLFVGAITPMLDNWAHVGGLIGGAAIAYYFGPRLHLLETPQGGKYLVDKPIIRLPRSVESIPEKVSTRLQRMTRRIQVNQHTSDLPSKPWRVPKQNIQRQRQLAPNRSIKPRVLD